MSVRVNLMPAAFVRQRRERRRRRAWIAACLILAVIQGAAASFAGRRAGETRRSQEQAAKLAASLKQEKMERDAARARADRLSHDITLSERLREKHCWSRWLGNLSLLTPEHVMLTAMSTEPPQFAAAQALEPRPAAAPGEPSPVKDVRQVRLRGSASRHDDLIAMLKALNGVKWFRSVQLLEAKRESVGERDAIAFALACEW